MLDVQFPVDVLDCRYIIYKIKLLKTQGISPFVGGGERGENAMKASGMLQEYKVVERCLLNPKCRSLPLYRKCIFAPNHVIAKSHLWHFVSQLQNMKKSSGEIVYCVQVFEIPLLGFRTWYLAAL